MKILKQFGIIAAVTCAGEILRYLLPLPVPASIYGLLLMLGLLLSGILKTEQVENAADCLIEIMSIMFVPAAVGLMNVYEELRAFLVPVVVILVVSTVLVMGVTGKVVDHLTREKEAEKHE